MITVRRAEPADAARIAEVHVQSWRSGYAGILSENFLAGLQFEPKYQRWQRTLDNPEHRSTNWVVELNGRIVGFAGLAPSRDEDLDPAAWRELMTIYLVADAWGTGAAHALCAECLDDTEQHFLWVLSDNHRAQAFYRKLGFVPDGKDQPITIGDRTVRERRMRRPAQL